MKKRGSSQLPPPLFILSAARGYGGAERNIETLLPLLAASRPVVIFAHHPLHLARLKALDLPGLVIHQVDLEQEAFPKRIAKRVLRLHEKLQPSAILVNSLESLRILERGARVDPSLTAKTVFYVHDFQWHDYAQLLEALSTATMLVPHRIVLERTDYVAQHVWPTGPIRGLVLPNAVAIPEISEPSAPAAPYLHLATVNRFKGHRLLADAAAMLRRRRPEIVIQSFGHRPDPTVYQRLRAHIAQIGADPTLTLHDHVEDVNVLIQNARAVLVTSVSDHDGPETFGRSIIEAWAHARPVIAFAAGAPARLIRHEVDGLLVDEKDVEGLAEAILRLHDDPTLAETLGRNGRARAEREFSDAIVASRLTRILDGLPPEPPKTVPAAARQESLAEVVFDVSLTLDDGWGTPVGMSRIEANVAEELARGSVPVRLVRFRESGAGYRTITVQEIEFLKSRNDGFGALAARERHWPSSNGRSLRGQAPDNLESRPGSILLSVSNPWDHVAAREFRCLREGGLRHVLAVHDLMVWETPQWTAGRDPRDYADNMLDVLAEADHLVCVSDTTAKVTHQAFAETGRTRPPIAVAGPSGLTPQATPRGSPPPGLDGGVAFVLYCSTIEVRKNHIMLLYLWDRLRKTLPIGQLPTLVFAGRWGWGVDAVRLTLNRNWRLAPHVRVFENLGDETLSWLYRHARFTLFPSFTEGYGFPAAESLAFGTPVVTSDAPALVEATAGLMPALDPADLPAWHDTISTLCIEDDQLDDLRRKARSYRAPSPDALPKAMLAAGGLASS